MKRRFALQTTLLAVVFLVPCQAQNSEGKVVGPERRRTSTGSCAMTGALRMFTEKAMPTQFLG